MRLETVKVLGAVAIPLAFLAAIWPAPSGQGMTSRGKGIAILPALRGHLDDAAALTIKTGSDAIHLTRKTVAKKPAEGWVLADKSGYPVPAATVRPVLDGLRALRGVERKTDRPALYSRLDLDLSKDGSAREVIVADAKGKTLGDVILGREKYDASGQGLSRIYVRAVGAPRAWLAEPPVTLPSDALDWIDHSVVTVDPDKVATVTVTQGNDTIIVARPKAGAPLVLMDLPAGGKLKTPSAAGDIAGVLHGLDLTDVKPAAKLAGTQAVRAKYETLDGLTVTVALTKEGASPWMTVAAAGAGKAQTEAEAINARVKGWAYQIAETSASPLFMKRGDLIEMPPAPVPAKDAKPASANTAPPAAGATPLGAGAAAPPLKQK